MKTKKKMSKTKFCVLFHSLLFLTCYINRAQSTNGPGVIISGPVDQVVEPGALATFNCHARGNTVHMFINRGDPYPQDVYEARGFNFTYTVTHHDDELDEHNNTIIVEAKPSNNRTIISCSARGDVEDLPDFQEGELTIAGPPLVPDVKLVQEYLIDGYVLSYLRWTTPFTWTDFPIVYFNVIVYDYFTGDTTTTVKTANSTDYVHQFVSHGYHCYEIDFTIIATNRLGWSHPAKLQAGHPIIPGEIGDIKTVIAVSSDEYFYLLLSFLVPRICPSPYQTGSYNITIYDQTELRVIHNHLGPVEYKLLNESEQELIVRNFSNVLERSRVYSIEVTAESIGVVQTKRKEIDTSIQEPLTEVSTQVETIDIKSQRYTTTFVGVIIGSTIGGTACLLIMFVIMLTVILCVRHRGRNRVLDSATTDGRCIHYAKPKRVKKKPQTLKLEESNPIYEGPLYESTPGESIKSLLSTCSSSPNTPSSSVVTPRYHGMNFPPSLPPPRNGSEVSQLPKIEPFDENESSKASLKTVEAKILGEEYMIMKNAQPDGKKTGFDPLSESHVHADELNEYATLK